MQYRFGVLFLMTALLASVGCGPADETLGVGPCNGKCDGISEKFEDLYSDMKKVDLADLVGQGANLLTGEVNNLLDEVPYSSIAISETEVFGTKQQSELDLSIEDLDALTAGLAARYGDKAFVTEINRLRAEYLHQHPGQVFGDAHFQLGPDFAHRLPFDADGFDGWLGFHAERSVEARVIAPFRTEMSAYKEAPIAALKSMRSFAVPRAVDDIREMAQGETLALRSVGRVGFNLGAGIPIYLTTVASVATLHAVFSAAAAVTLEGDLDVQLIRGAGSTAYVDVGLTGSSAQSFRLAVRTRWGVEGLPELEVGGFSLTDVAEKGLRDLLNKRLKVAEAAYSKSKSAIRHTVARFSFDLAQDDETHRQALYQALRGDLRLAQALAQREGSGVTQTLDLARDARSVSTYLGAEFLTLKFFRESNAYNGAVVVTTEEESQALLFDELAESYGFFWRTHGYTRRSLASLTSRRGQPVAADHNLRVSLRDSDSFTSRDQVLDHFDPMIAYFIGHERFVSGIAKVGDNLEHYLDFTCREPMDNTPEEKLEYEECLEELPQSQYAVNAVAQMQYQMERVISEGIDGGFDDKFDSTADFARALISARIDAQRSVKSALGHNGGPKSSLAVEYRLSAAALDRMLLASDARQRFEKHVKNVIYHRKVWRGASDGHRQAEVAAKLATLDDKVKDMGEVFEAYAAKYRQLTNVANSQHEAAELGHVAVGNHGHLVVVGRNGEVALRSVAERKATLTAQLFDALVDAASGTDDHKYSVVAYALLMGALPSEIEMLVAFGIKDSEVLSMSKINKYGRSATAELIGAGEFDVDALVTAQ